MNTRKLVQRRLLLKMEPLKNSYCQQGQRVGYQIGVANVSGKWTRELINLVIAIPEGLAYLDAEGDGWITRWSGDRGPALLTATYRDERAPGPLILKGTLTEDAWCTCTLHASLRQANGGEQNVTCTMTIWQAPDLEMRQRIDGPDSYRIGDTIHLRILARNLPGAGPATSSITLFDSLPAGLSQIQVSAGPEWIASATSAIGPGTLSALYIGGVPPVAGESLPEISVTAQITEAALPQGQQQNRLTFSGSITTAGDTGWQNNLSSCHLTVTT